MTRIIAAMFTLCVIALVVYLLFTAPWVIGWTVIIGGLVIVAFIFIMTIYKISLSFLENLEYTLRRRRALRQSKDK